MTDPSKVAEHVELSAQELSVVFKRSRSWLASIDLPERSVNGRIINQAMVRALGMWICSFIIGDSGITAPLIADQVMKVLRTAEEEKIFNPFEYDSKLVLLIGELLAANGYESSTLSPFAEEVGAEIRRMESIPARFVGESVLLCRRGLAPQPTVPKLTLDICPDGRELLSGKSSQVYSACEAISASTLFGLRALEAEALLLTTLRQVLPPILVQTLKEYDLDLGGRVLRAMSYCGFECLPTFNAALEFLVYQQHPSGRFGYLAKEAAALSESGTAPLEEIEERLYLPITVSCLWSLAESAFDGFRLLGAF
jgi:hypothetical protein